MSEVTPIEERLGKGGAYRCKACGSPLMATANGSVCPEGHGRLMPPLPAAVARLNEARILGIPVATAVRDHFDVEGYSERFLPGRIYRGKLERAHLAKHVVAIDADKIREFLVEAPKPNSPC